MITPLAFIILAQAGQERPPLFPAFNQYILSQGFERCQDSFRIGMENGRHSLEFFNDKGFRLCFTSSTFDRPDKLGRVADSKATGMQAAIYYDIPMKVASAGPVESTVKPKQTKTDAFAIRFNIEDAHVYMKYGHYPSRFVKMEQQFVNVEEAYRMLKPIAEKYAKLLKAELQSLRKEKRTRRN